MVFEYEEFGGCETTPSQVNEFGCITLLSVSSSNNLLYFKSTDCNVYIIFIMAAGIVMIKDFLTFALSILYSDTPLTMGADYHHNS